tara:strand:+ start:116 stop:712 length:597 start_codon:yes stop_codon:yes gene_type:complete
MVSGIDLRKYKVKVFFVSILLFIVNINFSLAQEFMLQCMQEDIYINEEKKRLSVKFPLRTEVRFYNFELKNDKITYFMPFLRSQDNFPEIWKFDIDLIQLKRSFTARKIPDNQMKTLVKLLNEAKVNTNAFLAQEKLEKDKFSNEIFNLKKDLFKKNYTNPDEWDDTKIPYGNSGDYILKKGEITYQSKFTFPCKIKN